jgi:hypothetical protein
VTSENPKSAYNRATNDWPEVGIRMGIRLEPTLDEARAELSEAISRMATSIFKDKYGPLLGIVSQPAVNAFLKGFEANVSRAKGDLTLVFEELLDRVVPKNLKNGK